MTRLANIECRLLPVEMAAAYVGLIDKDGKPRVKKFMIEVRQQKWSEPNRQDPDRWLKDDLDADMGAGANYDPIAKAKAELDARYGA